ncbi:hypothetical protein B0H14DRAFT_2927340 [Mycena olivaceomarginata]|nr:hypothetical protein B0H14DRAFT_2927340 [Mycena olivaceomarginata]
MPPSCTFSVSSPLLPPLGDRQRTASCLPPFARAIPRPAATDDTPLPTSTLFFSDEMILTHLPASRNTVHARVAEMVQAVVGNKVRNPLAPLKASITLACTSSSSAVTRCCAAHRRGHERAAGIFVEPDGVPGGVRDLPFTSLDSPPSLLHPSRTLTSTSAGANTSAPSMSGLMCAPLGHDRACTWTKCGPCSIDSKEWIMVSMPHITRLLVINTRCLLIFCQTKAKYALNGWIMHGADCFALWNAHTPRVCEGIGRRAGPLYASIVLMDLVFVSDLYAYGVCKEKY